MGGGDKERDRGSTNVERDMAFQMQRIEDEE